MSTLHMSYDDSAYYLHPSRDPVEYDIAMAPDMRPLGFGQQLSSDHLDGYIPASSSFVDHVIYDDAPVYVLPHPILSSSGFIDIRHPVPRRPISPEMLFPPEHPFLQSSSSLHQLDGYYPEAPGPLFPSGSFTQPSMFAPVAESSSYAQPAAAEEQPPPPPPSWAMSGSLDPATGIYQSAPEHPRVRTQQACEKCRGRKAKCSGELPCQRCVNRGLHCEYAPERKMRGPNKVKRNRVGTTNDKGPGRRASIASSVTSSDEEAARSPQQPPFTTAPRTFTMRFDMPAVADRDACSAPSSASGSPRSDHVPASPARHERARPPPISLEGTGLYDQASLPLAQAVPAYVPEVASPNTSRRASLPAYLLESHATRLAAASGIYSPSRGLDIIETTPRPRSSPVHPMQLFDNALGLSLISTSHSTGSSSGASMSTPITPLNVPMSDKLMYPIDFVPEEPTSGFISEFSQWINHDMDATPMVSGGEKSLGTVHDV